MKLYGIKLKAKRLGRGWTLDRVAKKARVHLNTVSRAERGLGISPGNASSICDVLDLDLREVMRPLDEGNAA